jgi:hypothetical protein
MYDGHRSLRSDLALRHAKSVQLRSGGTAGETVLFEAHVEAATALARRKR